MAATMEFNSHLDALNRLGGPFVYSQALDRSTGIPKLMLEANDILCHDGDVEVSKLIDQLAKQNWEGFRNPGLEPHVGFDKIYTKLLIKKDIGWSILKNKAKRRLGVGPIIRSLMSTNPKGFDTIPDEAHNTLAFNGWEYNTQSQRTIFKKDCACLKLALDIDGIEQNYNEAEFLRKYHGQHKFLIDGKYIKVNVPELYSSHGRYLWITREWIEGWQLDIFAFKNLPKFSIIKEKIMNRFPIRDIKPNNLYYDKSAYWIVDAGIPLTKTY